MKVRYIVSMFAILTMPAQAETVYRIPAHGVGCTTQGASIAANNAFRHGQQRPDLQNTFDCRTVDTAGKWTVIAEGDDTLLLRKTPPTPGLPPLYFPKNSVVPTDENASVSSTDKQARIEETEAEHKTMTASRNLILADVRQKNQVADQVKPVDMAHFAKNIENTLNADVVSFFHRFPHILENTGIIKSLGWLLGLGLLLKLVAAYRRRRAFRRTVQSGKKLIDKLADRLQIRRKQLVYQNAYGTTIYDKWNREKSEFMQREMYSHLVEHRCEQYFEQASPEILTYLDLVAFQEPRKLPEKISSPDHYAPGMDPFDYERYCAKLLRKEGWEALVTSECGDQGADVIASKNGLRVVLQCKLYSKAVGNDAVQQVAAARHHYSARLAAVVSNAPYTIPAQQLARTNKVFLLHHDELPDFVRRLEKSAQSYLRG